MDQLKEIVGPERVSVSYLERLTHSHDLAPVPGSVAMNYDNMPSAVVKPKSAREIARLIEAASRMRTCLIPKGRGTSYLWGSVPVVGGIVVDMVEMNEVSGFSAEEGWIEVEAGATWEKVEKRLSKHGCSLRVYPTSMPAATVGGWIAAAGSGLGAGGYGVGSIMYGSVGANIAKLEVVTGKGEALELTNDEDIADFVGMDGITGFITKVRLKIRKKPESTKRLFLTARNKESLQKLAAALGSMQSAYFAQLEDSDLVKCKLSVGLHSPPCGEGFLFFAAFEGNKETVSADAASLEKIAIEEGGKSFGNEEAEKEWTQRCYPMRVKRGGPTVVAGEFTVPSSRLAEALDDVANEMPEGRYKKGVHGVVVEPPNVLLLPQVFSDERGGFSYLASLSYSKRFNDVASRHGGKPYGVGHLSAFNSKLVHGDEGFERLKMLKKKHDPKNIINPGKGIEHGTKFGFSVPPFLFSLSMFGLGLFRKSGVKSWS